MNEYWKRSGGIPAFGNWDFSNELPISQYFENARQAGYGETESDRYVRGEHDLYAVDCKKRVQKAARIRENSKETRMRKHGKVYHVTEHPKAVDEDLYKISPQLLPTTKRKKMLGFIFKCLMPTACVS
ncbi:uncharacterized protein LOC127128875 [Lathyrus oleraceus]|uniref:RIN4 pathogenic type III effector avirulence factor Avr cleavage site domain-containing protein n=1 Tax=Pisum sativum TaxID=3888 RepID=A0A9D5AYM1_PEA|nr:uncharacterized protein LOC127128875 [Pisum sativum]KAI5423921.1 hypothetical protein KIW84_030225 [Pisum sativum]